MWFPLGVLPYLIGGAIIGLGVSFIYIITGIHATQSSFFSTTLSYFSKIPYFQQKAYRESRDWRVIFAIGVILGASIYTITVSPTGFYTTSIQWWRLALGGFLVGFGTRLSQGCTSGHGISGLASLSATSLYAVITFLAVGILTALIFQTFGVSP
ncbi:MAG: YeeE/YedE family protein [Candidatus Bathyarchaeota archaeon]|nr:MAG: YeeE/YedE family protein [Candidatus Bathyarchaeota archaeon]